MVTGIGHGMEIGKRSLNYDGLAQKRKDKITIALCGSLVVASVVSYAILG